jgi:hypothetical protein
MKGSRRRTLYHDRGIFTAQPEAIKKTAQSWRVSGGRSAYAHEPAQTTGAPEKPKPINISNEKGRFHEKYNAMAYKTACRWPEIGTLAPPDGRRRFLLGGSA